MITAVERIGADGTIGSMKVYLLAGGLSRRMGRPKAELELHGRSFIRRIVDACQPVFDEVVEVRRSGEMGSGLLRTVQEQPRPDGSVAPLFGIAGALEDSVEERAWILAIDFPLVTTVLLAELRERFEGSAADLLVPVWDGEPQLLCAGYRTTLLPEIAMRIDRRELRLRRLMEQCRTEVVTEQEIRSRFPGEPLMNVNTPEAFDRARAIAGGTDVRAVASE
ncbi:MAG TPA: molybdenum cofactor guanylyltransferase [Thermoanaerobaculia bacterium]|nr:molybdenum cofactor guanylyltransferase [Thermoanaerobaculia bacterium]